MERLKRSFEAARKTWLYATMYGAGKRTATRVTLCSAWWVLKGKEHD